MTPTLSLGPWDSPEIEILPSEINPIVALLIEEYAPLEEGLRDSIWCFLELDTLFLKQGTETFFQGFESICGRIASGELSRYSVPGFQASEFSGWLKGGPGTGVVTPETRKAAQRFLDFLAGHPNHWPLRIRDEGAAD